MTTSHRTTADGLIRKNGQVVTVTGSTDGVYDPAQGAGTKTPYIASAVALLFPVSALTKIDGTNIKAGDEQLLISGLDAFGAPLAAPPVNSVVQFVSGLKKTLISVSLLNHDGQANIYYDCVVRSTA